MTGNDLTSYDPNVDYFIVKYFTYDVVKLDQEADSVSLISFADGSRPVIGINFDIVDRKIAGINLFAAGAVF